MGKKIFVCEILAGSLRIYILVTNLMYILDMVWADLEVNSHINLARHLYSAKSENRSCSNKADMLE